MIYTGMWRSLWKRFVRPSVRRLKKAEDIEGLIHVLNSSNRSARYEALDALFALGQAARLLNEAEDSGKYLTWRDIASRIRRYRFKDAADACVRNLFNSDSYIREAAVNTLASLGWRPGHDDAGLLYRLLCGEEDLTGHEPVMTLEYGRLLEVFPDLKSDERCRLVLLLTELLLENGRDAPLPFILERLIEKAEFVGRQEMFYCESRLGEVVKLAGRIGLRIHDPALLEKLIRWLECCLKNYEWAVRKAAAKAMINLYSQGQLSGALRIKIINKKDEITGSHIDNISSPGCRKERGLWYSYGGGHTDIGIGIDF